MKVIVFADSAGNMRVRVPVGPRKRGEAEEAYLDRIADAHPAKPGMQRVAILDHTELPYKDYPEYKDARRWDGTKIVVSMAKARAIHTRRLLQEQDRELKVLIEDERRARVQGDTAQADSVSDTIRKVEAVGADFQTRLARADTLERLKKVRLS